MPKKKKLLFGEYLVRQGLISEEQLVKAIHHHSTIMSHRKIGEVLVRAGYINSEEKELALAKHLGIKINLKLSLTKLQKLPSDLKDHFDEVVSQVYRVVPIARRSKGWIHVASDRCLDSQSIINLGLISGYKVRLVFVSLETFMKLFEARYGKPFTGFTKEVQGLILGKAPHPFAVYLK